MMLLRQLGVSQGHQSVQLMLNGMVFGGTFDRHPTLTVVIAECGLHWFEGTLDHMDSRDARTRRPGCTWASTRSSSRRRSSCAGTCA